MLMMLAQGEAGGAHHVVRPGVTQNLHKTTATRSVYGTRVGRPRGAADAHGAGLGPRGVEARKTQRNAGNTAENPRYDANYWGRKLSQQCGTLLMMLK